MRDFLISIKRTPFQSAASFLVLFFSLFLTFFLLFSLAFFEGILAYLETRPQIIAYFQPKTNENEIFKIRDELVSSGKVLSINYTNQKEAFENYKKMNQDNPLLLEMVSADILPPSLEIYAKKPIFLPQIAEYLKKQASVDEVQFQKDILDRLLTLTSILRKTSLTFFIYLFLMTTTVLVTITHFKIALKKDEIEILNLLGASYSYIRRPFLKEAFFMAIFASIFAFSIILAILFYFQPFLNSYLQGISSLSLNILNLNLLIWPINWSFLSITFLVTSLFGVLVSLFSTFLATKKYL
jgi:cell division transport system permease protein